MRKHKSVMLKEVIENLLFKKDCTMMDLTLGSGGHSLEILSKIESGTLIVVDSDIESINDFRKKLESLKYNKIDDDNYEIKKKKVILKNRNFSEIKEILSELEIEKIDGYIADLGWSMDQLNKIPGLSYSSEEEILDMRLNKALNAKAHDLLNYFNQKSLVKMFRQYADIYGKDNEILVKKIIEKRSVKPFEKVGDLMEIIIRKNDKSYYAKVFQALRIAVNNEYENLEKLLHASLEVLNPNGRALILTFHSGESEIVENFIKSGKVKSLFLRNREIYQLPGVEELRENISSRSAKLYGFKNE